MSFIGWFNLVLHNCNSSISLVNGIFYSYFAKSSTEISMDFMLVRILKFHTEGQKAGVKKDKTIHFIG